MTWSTRVGKGHCPCIDAVTADDRSLFRSTKAAAETPDQTNGKIKVKAPATYLADAEVFPSGADAELLSAHFIDDQARALMEEAGETTAKEQVADLYQPFLQAREAAMIEEIRKACGITPVTGAPVETDEIAADIEAGGALPDEIDDEIERSEMLTTSQPAP
jgi:hypothetical protein